MPIISDDEPAPELRPADYYADVLGRRRSTVLRHIERRWISAAVIDGSPHVRVSALFLELEELQRQAGVLPSESESNAARKRRREIRVRHEQRQGRHVYIENYNAPDWAAMCRLVESLVIK